MFCIFISIYYRLIQPVRSYQFQLEYLHQRLTLNDNVSLVHHLGLNDECNPIDIDEKDH